MTQGWRISVADDEGDMRDFFTRILKRCGHEVVSAAESGRDLVEHCRELQPDLVITDVKMPEMDGIEASREICRERPVPVILVSAHSEVSFAERAEGDSILAYLVKPIGRDDLVRAIAIAMRRFEEIQTFRKEAADLRQALVAAT
jgi:AmiR/NasT family two-component response regulator